MTFVRQCIFSEYQNDFNWFLIMHFPRSVSATLSETHSAPPIHGVVKKEMALSRVSTLAEILEYEKLARKQSIM